MTTALHGSLLLSLTLTVAACGSDDASSPSPDAGPGADAGRAPDASEPMDATVGEDATTAPDAGAECRGRRTATIGPEGGTLEHCGGRLVVEPGAFAEAVELGIEPATSPGDVALPYARNGRVLRFTPEDAPLPGQVELHLPHDGTIARQEAARWVEGEGWYLFEVCDLDEATVWQTVSLLGVFAAVGDPTDYPEGPDGLGTGEVDFVLDGASDHMEITPDGYAIYEGIEGWMVTLLYRRNGDVLEQLELRFWIDGDGPVEPVMASHYSGATGEIWSADAFAHPGAISVDLAEEGAMLRGTAEGLLYRGDESRALSATFEATPVLFRFPPERACGFPEG